jgi:hypothetical protein
MRTYGFLLFVSQRRQEEERTYMLEFAIVALIGFFLYNLRSIHLEFGPKKIDTPSDEGVPRNRRLRK